MYEIIYQYYVQQQPNCFEIVVEDAADDFQKVQDITNAKMLVELLKEKGMPKQFKTSADVINWQLTVVQAKQIAKQMKLPTNLVYRLYDLVMFARLTPAVET